VSNKCLTRHKRSAKHIEFIEENLKTPPLR